MFSKVKDFFKSNIEKISAVPAVAGAVSVFSTVGSSATGYTPQAVPSPAAMDLSEVGNVWLYAQSFLQDTISIISQHSLLIIMCIALPLIGVGVGLFKRIIN